MKGSLERSKRSRQGRRFSRSSLRNVDDFCHVQHSELAAHLNKHTKEESCFAENGKDDFGCQAVQGASASQVTAGKVRNRISRLLGMAGEANDAASAFTQEKMKDASSLLKLPATISDNLDTALS